MQDASPLGCFVVGRQELMFLEPRTVFFNLYVTEAAHLMSVATTHCSKTCDFDPLLCVKLADLFLDI
jgi:hypothetical protein